MNISGSTGGDFIVDESSCPCTKSELDFEWVPPTQIAIDRTFYEKCYPITDLSSQAPLDFSIITSDDYFDPSQSYLYIKCKILRDGSAITTDDKLPDIVFPTNYLIGTLFKELEITLNNYKISQSSSLYAYRSIFETLLNYGNDIDETWLKLGLYAPDKADFDLVNVDIRDSTKGFVNTGARERFNLTKKSKQFEMIGRLHHEIFHQPKLLPSHSDIRLKLERNDPRFFLLAKDTSKKFTLQIDEAVFYACKKTVSKSVVEKHEKLLITRPFKYPLRRISMRHFVRSGGLTDISEQNLYTGFLPRRVVVGVVSSDRFNDNITKNPLFFDHHKITNINLKVNGQSVFPEIEADFENDLFSQPYTSFLKGCNLLFAPHKNAITPSMFKDGNALFVFNLALDGEDSGGFSMMREGKLSLEIKTSASGGFANPLTIVVLFEHDAVLEINKDRQVRYLEDI